MKIASITVTNDDDHTLDQWLNFYQIYKDEVYLHIIVDNCSSQIYRDKVKEKFPDSIFIERETNGGTTAAYNDGIKYALNDLEVDSIALIAQDIKFADGALSELHKLLFSDEMNGLVGPVLFRADSDLIEAYGTKIKENMLIDRLYNGQMVEDIPSEIMAVDLVPGGANLARREAYEKIGLQDETLFMYGDETDFDIRLRNAGYKLLVTTRSSAWHQHINISCLKYGSGTAFYYNNRNIIILNYRYTSSLMALKTFFYLFVVRGPLYYFGFLLELELRKCFLYFAGLIAGITRFMRNWVHE